jgi:hypothetical protein
VLNLTIKFNAIHIGVCDALNMMSSITIVVVIMVDASNTSSATTAVMTMTNATARRVPLSARARASSPAIFTASEECHANLCTQVRYKPGTNNSNKKRRHESHFNNNLYTSSDKKSRRSAHTPMPSNGNARASNKAKPKRIST